MKQAILFLCLWAIAISAQAQKISRDKQTCINNIKAAGYEVKNPKTDIFGYIRFDKFGKSAVYYECTGNIVRQVTFLCENGLMPTKMWREVLANMSWEDQKKSLDDAKATGEENDHTTLYAYDTEYYTGKAKYTYRNDYQTKQWGFTIIIIN
ncbi:MAG: hypothetical protein JSS82_08050 [Bacteroidetes bacterium]|nr:hypothetical protein [Bacteroidota bacterium]